MRWNADKKKRAGKNRRVESLVGMARFERAVSESRTRRSTKLSHIPNEKKSTYTPPACLTSLFPCLSFFFQARTRRRMDKKARLCHHVADQKWLFEDQQ